MKQLHTLAIVIWLLLTASTAEAAPLSLKECYEAAIEQSLAWRLSGEKLNESGARIAEAEGARLPVVNAAASVTHNGNVQTVKFGASSMQFQPDNSYRIGLTASSLLYDGNRLANVVTLQKEALHLTELDRARVEQDLAGSVSSAYYVWVLLREVEEVMAASAESSKEHLKLAEARYEAGQLSRFELSRTRVQTDQFTANAETATSNRRRAVQTLCFLTGLTIGDQTVPTDTLRDVPFSVSFEVALEAAQKNRIEYEIARQAKAVSMRSLAITRAGLYPMATANANLAWANGSDMSDMNKLVNSWSVGIGVSYPIFDGKQVKRRIEAGESAVRQSELTSANLDVVVGNELRFALITLEDSRRKLDLQFSYLDQAAEALRLAREQFRLGMATSQDVSDAELAYEMAQTNRAQALYDWTMAVISIRKASGELTSNIKRGILQ